MIRPRTARHLFVLTGLVIALGAALGSASARNGSTTMQPVDAATFALAVLQGHGDDYKGRTITGTGADFHGSGPSLALTVGAAAADGPPTPVTTWGEFIAAQRVRTTLVVSLNVAGFRRTSWPRQDKPPV